MYFEHLTMRDGLSQSTVMSILQDSRGFLWLATESGLDRYDGYSIHEYRRARGSEHALASDYIWKIAEDARGDLWLATSGGGLARWVRREDRFQTFRHDPRDPNTLASDAIRTLLIDAQGRVWAATEGHGLDVLDPQTGRARHFRHRAGDPRSLAADQVFVLYTDRAGRLWVGTAAGLSRYEPATDDFVNDGVPAELAGASVRAIFEDHARALWIGTLDKGLLRLDPQTNTVKAFRHDPDNGRSLSTDRVRTIMEDDARRLWIATTDGLNLFDRASESFVRYGLDADNPHSLRDDEVMSLYQDRGGVLWVGTRAGGASHWNPKSWALGHYRSELIRNNAVNAFADDGAGTVWVGTSHGLVEIGTAAQRERRYGKESDGPLRLADDRVMALLYDRGGALWVGTMTGGLDRFDRASGSLRSYRHVAEDESTLPAKGVMCLYEDRGGDLWIGTWGGGIARIERASGTLMRYPHGAASPNSLSSPRAGTIVEDLRGNLWIGTVGGGLNLLDRRTGRFHHYRRNDRDPSSLSDDTVYALHVDADGTVWVGTAGGGLDRVIGGSDRPEAVRFQSEARFGDMPSQVVYGIESDGQGRLWLSTNNGLVRLDPRSGASRLFREAHGLQADEFNFNAHYRGRDGTLFFGGNGGFNAFVPEEALPNAPPPRVALTSVEILNKPLSLAELPGPGRPLALTHDQKLVTFEFAALDFISPANNRYQHQLVGFDSGWVDAGRLHRATYTNLDAGEYVFKVRAANVDGVWSEHDLTIPVQVAAAPWNTLTARLLYAAVVILILSYLWHQHQQRRERELQYSRDLEKQVSDRTRQLEERNHQLLVLSRARSDFVARMNHELRTPMNGVLGMSELLIDTRLDATQRRFVEGIHRSADSLLAIVDDVLDFSKLEAGRLQLAPVECDLVELVEQTTEMLAARAAGKRIELLCDTPAQPLPRVQADVVRLRQVLVNLGGNAVKFTDQGEVTLRVMSTGQEGEQLRVRFDVVDTGIGIEPKNQSRIFEEFVQEDASTTRRYGGTGLGLSITRQLVGLMGGQLSLVSTPGLGSTFSVELALPLVDPSVQLRAAPNDLDGLRILVAENSQALRRLIARALNQWGAQALDVGTFSKVLQELRSTAYNAVIIGESLLEGEVVRELQSLLAERVVRPRVICLASFVRVTQSQTSNVQWFDAEITKPMRLTQLHRALTGRAEADYAQSSGHPAPVAPLAGGGRVLVVEDQSLNRDVAEGMLQALGLEVDSAHDGRHALEMLERGSYDVVLMDCRMPVMDGFAATAELRRREGSGPRIPVVALTADTTGAAREACLAAGMDDYLGKPFSRANLRAALARWLPARAPAQRDSPDSGSAVAPDR